ncbi:MAG: membrane protein insertion efficiency factor YidD [Elusimicrobia bacterium]|nr:membrane protein insertion efficiency factor YidD [Elusimicrobiota bacterium]
MGYQTLLRGILPPACRFYPTCSDYTLQAINANGVGAGIKLGLRRLLTCHPFSA